MAEGREVWCEEIAFSSGSWRCGRKDRTEEGMESNRDRRLPIKYDDKSRTLAASCYCHVQFSRMSEENDITFDAAPFSNMSNEQSTAITLA